MTALWVTGYGFTLDETTGGVSVLSRDGWAAEVGDNSHPGAPGRVWFEVTTPPFPADAAEAAVAEP